MCISPGFDRVGFFEFEFLDFKQEVFSPIDLPIEFVRVGVVEKYSRSDEQNQEKNFF
jgi:hypothetical protein